MGKYDFEAMAAKMAPFIGQQDSFCKAIKDADGSVDDNVQTTSGAIRGILGNKLKKEWDDNCTILLNFDAYFDDLTRRAVDVYNSKSEATDEVVASLTDHTTEVTTAPLEMPKPVDATGITGEGGE